MVLFLQSAFDSLVDMNMAYCSAVTPTALRALFRRCHFMSALNLDGVIHCDESTLILIAELYAMLTELRMNECKVAVTDKSMKQPSCYRDRQMFQS